MGLPKLLSEHILEELEKIISELVEKSRQSIPIIVEGERDERALRNLGIEGKIVKLNVGMPLVELSERLAQNYSEVIILTDWDYHGGKLCRLLIEALEANGIKPELSYRKKLSYLCKKEIKDVESLFVFFETIKER